MPNHAATALAAPPAASAVRLPGLLRHDGVVLLAIVAISLLLRVWWFANPVIDHDEQLYSLIGQGMLDGRLPYVDLWDRKPIGLFVLYAAAHALFGPAPTAYLPVADMFACAGAWLVFRIAARLADRPTGLVAALLYLVGMGMYGCRGGQSELFFAVPCLGMAALLLTLAPTRRGLCMAMLLGGLAIQIKYTAAPFCAVAGLIALRRRWQAHHSATTLATDAAAFAALGLLPTTLVALGYAALGHWHAFAAANFVSIFDRPQMVGRFSAQTPAVIGPLVLAMITGGWAFWRSGRHYDGRHYATLAALTAGALGTIYCTVNVMAYYYAFLVPWAVLLAVPFIDLRCVAGRIGAAMLVACFLVAAQIPARVAEGRADSRAFEHLASRIRAAGPDAGLYVFSGPTALYAATGNASGRYPFPSHHSSVFETHSLGTSQDGLVAQALAAQPRFIVTQPDYDPRTAAPAVPRVMGEVHARFDAVARVRILDQPLVLWQRR